MWIAIALFVVAIAILCRWVWWELLEWRLERLAEEDRQMWLRQTRDTNELDKRWSPKIDP